MKKEGRKISIVTGASSGLGRDIAKLLSKKGHTTYVVARRNDALIELKNGKLSLKADKLELSKKTLEEQFIESLPLKFESLEPEQKYALESLKNRKEIFAGLVALVGLCGIAGFSYNVCDGVANHVYPPSPRVHEYIPFSKRVLLDMTGLLISGGILIEGFRRYKEN